MRRVAERHAGRRDRRSQIQAKLRDPRVAKPRRIAVHVVARRSRRSENPIGGGRVPIWAGGPGPNGRRRRERQPQVESHVIHTVGAKIHRAPGGGNGRDLAHSVGIAVGDTDPLPLAGWIAGPGVREGVKRIRIQRKPQAAPLQPVALGKCGGGSVGRYQRGIAGADIRHRVYIERVSGRTARRTASIAGCFQGDRVENVTAGAAPGGESLAGRRASAAIVVEIIQTGRRVRGCAIQLRYVVGSRSWVRGPNIRQRRRRSSNRACQTENHRQNQSDGCQCGCFPKVPAPALPEAAAKLQKAFRPDDKAPLPPGWRKKHR